MDIDKLQNRLELYFPLNKEGLGRILKIADAEKKYLKKIAGVIPKGYLVLIECFKDFYNFFVCFKLFRGFGWIFKLF